MILQHGILHLILPYRSPTDYEEIMSAENPKRQGAFTYLDDESRFMMIGLEGYVIMAAENCFTEMIVKTVSGVCQ